MKRIGLVVIVLMVVLAFVAGYWPQHKKLVEAQEKLAGISAQIANLETTIRLYELQSQLVTLVQETERKNYANAAEVSTKFFDTLSGELLRTTRVDLKSSMQSILNQRDALTAALAKADPAALDLLKQLLATLSQSIKADGPPSLPKN